MEVFLTQKHAQQPTEYNVDGLPCCPKCGSKPFISKDIIDGFYFGWSVGCPQFKDNDGIHGTTANTKAEDTYTIFHLNSREECIKEWKKRVDRLKQ